MDLWKDKKWNAAVIKLQFSSAVKYLLKFELKFKHHVDLSEEKKFVLKMSCVFINFWVLKIWYIVSGKTVFSLQATHWFLHLWVDCNWEDYFHLSLLFCLAGTVYGHLITHTIDKGWLDSVSTQWMQTNKDQISTFDNQQDLQDFLLREAHRVYPVTLARAGVQGQRSPTLVKAEMKMSTDAGRRAWRLKPISEFAVRDLKHAVGYRLWYCGHLRYWELGC